MHTQGKVVSFESLPLLVRELKEKDKRIVTTNGAFDMLHVGHKRALEMSRSLGDVLIVAVNSDSSIKQYKSELRPIITQEARAELLAGLACVDYVTIFDEINPIKFLEIVRPDIHTKGGDYEIEELLEYEVVRKNGGTIIKTDSVESTSRIIEKILKVYG